MGTNYYLHTKKPCKKCGRAYEPLHIGKSSGGWCFSLHIIPEEGIHDLADWKRLWKKRGSFILDEYGDRVDTKMMTKIIENRSWKGGEPWDRHMLEYNGAVVGPNGLVRNRVDGRCVKHGAGTWDCIEGEFS